MRQFKIYPFRTKKGALDKKSWWKVIVSDNLKSFRKLSTRECKVCKRNLGGTPDTHGLTHSHGFKVLVDDYGNVKKAKVNGEFGVIFLLKSKTGGGVVSHEMTHAMIYTLFRYTNVINFQDNFFAKVDEQMAGIVGNLVNNFYTQYL